MSVLVIGDPHFDPKHLSTIDVFTSQILHYVSTKKPGAVFVMGDILHTFEKARVECHTRAVKWFKDMAAYSHVVVLIGNHDRPNPNVFLTKEHFFTGIECDNLVIVDDAPYKMSMSKGDKVRTFVAVPYVPKGRLHEVFKRLDRPNEPFDMKSVTAVFAHQDIMGAKMGAVVCRDGDVWPADYPLLINGHYHEHQELGDNIFMPGTPYQTTYSEEVKKGIYLFDWWKADKDPKQLITSIKLNIRIKCSKTVTVDEFLHMPAPDVTFDLRIVVQGEQQDVEACKKSKKYKDFTKLKHVKVVLVPILKMVEKKKRVDVSKTYVALIYNEIQSDPDMLSVFTELLKDFQ